VFDIVEQKHFKNRRFTLETVGKKQETFIDYALYIKAEVLPDEIQFIKVIPSAGPPPKPQALVQTEDDQSKLEI